MSNTLGDVTLKLILDAAGIAGDVKKALTVLEIFSKTGKQLLDLKAPQVDMSRVKAEIDTVISAENKLQAETKQTAQDNTTLAKSSDKVAKSQTEVASSVTKSAATIVKLQSSMESLGLRLQGIQMLYDGLKSTFGEFINMYHEQEIAYAKLSNGLKNVGEGVDSVNRLMKQASQLKDVTPFDDEEIQNAQAMLTTFKKSSDEIAVLTPRILDMAAAYMQTGDSSMSLQQLAVMVGKVNEETIGGLRRIGVAFSKEQEEVLKSLTGLEQANYLAGILDTNFKGMAETVGNTAAGKMKIFKNQTDELKKSMGKLISDGILPLLSPVKSVIEWFEKGGPAAHKLALGLIALGAAAVLLNSQFGALPYILVAIVTAISMLPGMLKAVAAGGTILIGILIALNLHFMVLNVTLGGIPMAVGLIVTGLASLVAVLSTADSKVKDLTGSFKEASDLYDRTAEDMNKLNELYQLQSKNTELTTNEQDKYNLTLKDLASRFPGILAGIDSITGEYYSNAESVSAVIEQEKELQKLRAQEAMLKAVSAINQITVEYDEQIDRYDELKKKVDLYNSALADLNRQRDAGLIDGNQYKFSLNVLSESSREVKKEFIESSKAVNELRKNLTEVAIQSSKFSDLANYTSLIKVNSGESAKTTALINETIGKIVSGDSMGKFLAQSETLKKNLEDARLSLGDFNREISKPTVKPSGQGGRQSLGGPDPEKIPIWAKVLKDAADMEEKYNEDTVTSTGGVDHRFKQPFDRAGALLKAVRIREDELKLIDKEVDNLELINELTREKNEISQDDYNSADKRNQLQEKINSLLREDVTLSERINKQGKELRDIENENLSDVFEKKKASAQFKLDDQLEELAKKKLPDDLKMKLEMAYRDSFKIKISEIELDVSDAAKEKIKKQIEEIKRTIRFQLGSAVTESMNEALFSSINDSAHKWLLSAMGGEANSIFEKFLINAYDRIIDMVQRLLADAALQLLLTLFTGGGGGFFSKIVGAVTGGATGATGAMPGASFASGGAISNSGFGSASSLFLPQNSRQSPSQKFLFEFAEPRLKGNDIYFSVRNAETVINRRKT